MIIKPLIKNFIVYQGTTFMANFSWNVIGYPLTDECIGTMQIRPDIKSDTVICEATTENEKIIVDVTNNIISIKIPSAETEDFDFEKAVYDLELQFPNGDKFRIVQGTLSLNPEVTRIKPVVSI